jgi:hypothetical protein
MLLIGFAGYAQSGKDTAARALAPLGFTRVAFADPLRALAAALAPPAIRAWVDADGWEAAKVAHPAARAWLQQVGDAARAALGADVFIRAALDGLDPAGAYAVADVRFPREAAAIQARGGRLVRLVRPGVGPANGHPSETALDAWRAWDAIVLNDGPADALAAQVQALAQSWFGARLPTPR